MPEKISEKTVILLALVSEGAILAIAILWAYFRSITIPSPLSSNSVLHGILWTFPLLILNLALFHSAKKTRALSSLNKFLDDFVVPLCSELNIGSALIVALCSGLGEEVFFRGVMNVELERFFSIPVSIIISSFLFAYLHFVGRVKDFFLLLPIYFSIGIYLSVLVQIFHSLVPALICHCFYNFTAIIFIRYHIVRKPNHGTN